MFKFGICSLVLLLPHTHVQGIHISPPTVEYDRQHDCRQQEPSIDPQVEYAKEFFGLAFTAAEQLALASLTALGSATSPDVDTFGVLNSVMKRSKAYVTHACPKLPVDASCAVVGNSGGLLNSRLGKDIDSHDIVLRINEAPTFGFEQDVGNRTHIRLQNAFSHFDQQQIQNVCSIQTEQPLTFATAEYRRLVMETMAYSMWQTGGMPKSGTLGILLLASVCKDVQVYGFDSPETATIRYEDWNAQTPLPPNHYWDDVRTIDPWSVYHGPGQSCDWLSQRCGALSKAVQCVYAPGQVRSMVEH